MREIIGVLADDFDRFLVRANGAIRSKPKELRAHNVVRLDREIGIEIEARMRQIVVDAYREMILGRWSCKILEHRLDHRRREFFRRQTVAAADHSHVAATLFVKRVHTIEIKRLASRSGFFRAVENGDVAHILRQHFDERSGIEGPIQPHFQDANFFVLRVEEIDSLVHSLAT